MMRTNEEYKDLIDSLMKGNLSASETAQLETEALHNTSLQAEISLQKTVVEALQANRKAELKARLKAIEVAPVAGSKIWKYAAVMCGLLLTGVATYYVSTNTKQEEAEVEATNIPLSLQESTATTSVAAPLVVEEPVSKPRAEMTQTEASVIKDAKKEAKKAIEPQMAEEGVPSSPELNAPEAISHEPLNKEIINPEHGLGKTSHLHASMTGVEVVKSKKHKFHYRYFDNKLFLYGDFEAKTYEILELNTHNGQELYLKFENKYYDLEPNKTEISKLETVKNKETLKELEEIQKK